MSGVLSVGEGNGACGFAVREGYGVSGLLSIREGYGVSGLLAVGEGRGASWCSSVSWEARA